MLLLQKRKSQLFSQKCKNISLRATGSKHQKVRKKNLQTPMQQDKVLLVSDGSFSCQIWDNLMFRQFTNTVAPAEAIMVRSQQDWSSGKYEN